MSWYLAALKKYAVFSGRARRREYWMYILFSFIITLAISIVESIIAGIAGINMGTSVFAYLYLLAVMLPTIGVSIRRMHDTGRSGWWLFIALVPLIGVIILIVFLAQDSQPGENKYGPNPKQAAL